MLMLAAILDKVSLGTPSAYRNLTLTPILLKDGPLSHLEPMSLEEALGAGTLRVSEVSAEGHVPELRVENSGEAAVLILDGEELVGAKQNRIVNVTILVPPHSEIVIPVSCIEAGRWGYSRPSFAAAGRVLNPEIRSRKAEAVTRNLKARKMRFSDQRAVWDGVDKMLYALGAASPTRALSDGFEGRVNAIGDYVAAFKLQPGQVGVLYRIGGVLAGLDLFASERTFARAFAKLARGSALQALAGYDKDRSPSLDEPGFLRAALTSPADRFPAVGLGEELRIDTDSIGGGALQVDSGLVHLFAFARSSARRPD
jgi:ARG/rhodanese/phosphatase superfamily protein